MKIFVLFILLGYFSLNVFAQESFENDTIRVLDVFTVTATKKEQLLSNTPEVMRIITATEIRALNASSDADVLNYFSGVNMEGGTGAGLPKRSIVNMNGLPANYNLVLVDGVRLLSDHIHTGQNTELIPVENIERIEIIRGASSAQYGSDALGGIVNIITKKCGDKPSYGMFGAYGSFNTINGGISVMSPVNENLKTTTYVNWEQSEGVDILAPVSRVGQMGYNRLAFMNRLENKFSDKVSGYFLTHYTGNRAKHSGTRKSSALFIPTAGVSAQLNEKLSIDVRTSFSLWEGEQNFESNKLFMPEFFINYAGLKNNTLQAGADFKYNEFSRAKVKAGTQKTMGVFVQDVYEISQKFHLMGAVRYDNVSGIADVVSPKLALLFKPTSYIFVRASVAKGFHAPTVQEMYEEGFGHSGRALRFGNPDLKPEYSTTYALSADYYFPKGLSLTATGYYSTIENMIVPVYQGVWEKDPTKDVWMRTNILKAEVYGFDLIGRWIVSDELLFEGGYSHAGNKNADTHRQLPYTPGKAANGKIIYSYQFNDNYEMGFFTGARVARGRSAWNWKPAQGSSADNPDGLIYALDDYEKWDAGISLTIHKNFTLYFNAYNLLEKEIQTLDDAYTVYVGKRTYIGGFKMRF